MNSGRRPAVAGGAHETTRLKPITADAAEHRTGGGIDAGTGAGSGGTQAGGVRDAAAGERDAGRHVVVEAYSFACMNCGHCWEQSYEIEHHTDTSGRPYVTYRADGVEVPSPLTRPACGNCDGHQVRIMRPGQVSDVVARRWALQHRTERGVQRTRHWPTLHFLRRRPPRPPE